MINFGPAFATSSVTVEKNLFNKIKLFNEDSNYLAWEDYDAWLKCARISNKFFFLKNTLGCTYIGQQNTSNISIRKKNLFFFKKKYKTKKKIFNLPFWYNWTLMRLLFAKGKYKSSMKIINLLFSKLSIQNLPKIFFFYFYILFKLKLKNNNRI